MRAEIERPSPARGPLPRPDTRAWPLAAAESVAGRLAAATSSQPLGGDGEAAARAAGSFLDPARQR